MHVCSVYIDVLGILCVYYFLKNTNTNIYGFLNWASLARRPDSEKSIGFLKMASPGRATIQQDQMLKNTIQTHNYYTDTARESCHALPPWSA